MTYEDSEYRDAYFAKLERVEEIMAGDPEYVPGIGRQIAHEYASRLTAGTPIDTGCVAGNAGE